MSDKNVYEECPVYHTEAVSLKQTTLDDAEELLKCYSDEKAVPFFNADNCPDNFHYTTPEQMRSEINFWNRSYQTKWFVRWTVIQNDSSEKIGSIEMFNRGTEACIGSHGVLRIDLRSDHENRQIIESILEIANRHFYEDFDVTCILTKAIPTAKERILSLTRMGYTPISFEKAHYYARKENL
ncbi:N-acetyltransferase [Sporolactobacillus shoreae]|uniref:N-acetyltransferase n=1 Tax=Sporolactobacillus shoreae TaxID=1465501 RepID=A0A4Z0GMZ9_9BACL|nr:GNAT family protein [Sporolactobacillus shoreae]TGA97677.1 N-acetyltransferase [Sporolactobacillus shoreae]